MYICIVIVYVYIYIFSNTLLLLRFYMDVYCITQPQMCADNGTTR